VFILRVAMTHTYSTVHGAYQSGKRATDQIYLSNSSAQKAGTHLVIVDEKHANAAAYETRDRHCL
jgi:hypothetical protein